MSQHKLPLEWIEKIFMRLHGRFGNTFLDKFRIGELNKAGQDIGIENAKAVWSEELAGVNAERIKAGLSANYSFAPSCDEFKANCVVRSVSPLYKKLAAPIDREHHRQQAEKVIGLVMDMCKPNKDRKAWAKDLIAANDRGEIVSEYALRSAQEALLINESR